MGRGLMRRGGASGPAGYGFDSPGGCGAHPGSVGSTMNVVHVFFLKILGIQLWGTNRAWSGAGSVLSRGARALSQIPGSPDPRPPPPPPPPPRPGLCKGPPRTQDSGRPGTPLRPPISLRPQIWASGRSPGAETSPGCPRPGPGSGLPGPSRPPPCCEASAPRVLQHPAPGRRGTNRIRHFLPSLGRGESRGGETGDSLQEAVPEAQTDRVAERTKTRQRGQRRRDPETQRSRDAEAQREAAENLGEGADGQEHAEEDRD